MQNFPGVGVSPGRIIGTVRQMPKPISEPPAGEQLPAGVTAEEATAALKAAAKAVHDELKARAETVSGDGKAVLEATALMATDTMLLKSATKLIGRGTPGSGPSGKPAPPSRKCCTTWAATWPSAPPTSSMSGPGSWRNCAASPRRAFPSPPPRSSSSPRTWPRPTPPPWIRKRSWPWSPPAADRSPTPRSSPARWACRPWSPPSASTSSPTAPRCTWTARPASSPRTRMSPSGRPQPTGPPRRRCWPPLTGQARRRTATSCRSWPTSAAPRTPWPRPA